MSDWQTMRSADYDAKYVGDNGESDDLGKPAVFKEHRQNLHNNYWTIYKADILQLAVAIVVGVAIILIARHG